MIKNRVTEKDIREWLNREGYFGSSARFEEIELHAIERPGWLQIFRFTVEAKSKAGQWEKLFGVVRDDERKKRASQRTAIACFAQQDEQVAMLDEFSEGLLTCRAGQNGPALAIMLIFAALTTTAIVGKWLLGL